MTFQSFPRTDSHGRQGSNCHRDRYASLPPPSPAFASSSRSDFLLNLSPSRLRPTAFSCNLLTNDMDIFILSAETEEGARLQIEGGLNKIASMNGPPVVRSGKKLEGTSHKTTGFAVVIDGDTLRFALDSGLKTLFLDLATQCETVVCCRVSVSWDVFLLRFPLELLLMQLLLFHSYLAACSKGCDGSTGQGRTKRHDSFDRRRSERCCHDSGSPHRSWSLWTRGISGCYVC